MRSPLKSGEGKVIANLRNASKIEKQNSELPTVRLNGRKQEYMQTPHRKAPAAIRTRNRLAVRRRCC